MKGLRWIAITVFCLLPTLAQGGTLIIEVADSEGWLLPNVHVVLQHPQTQQRAYTDTNGRCAFLFLPSGQYTVHFARNDTSASLKNIPIAPETTTELTATIDFAAPHVSTDIRYLNPGTGRVLTHQNIIQRPAHGYQALIAQQPGILTRRNRLHNRGGRADEIAVYIDDILQRNPVIGQSKTDIPSTAIDQIAVMTSGFGAQYGHAMSGVVHVVTPQNLQSYTGAIETITDRPAKAFQQLSFGYNIVSASIGGPILPSHKGTTFYVSHEWQHLSDATPRYGVFAAPIERDYLSENAFNVLSRGQLPHNRQTQNAFLGKLNTRFKRVHLHTIFQTTTTNREHYEHSYRYDLAHAPRTRYQIRSGFLTIQYPHDKNLHITARIGGTTGQYQQGDGVHFTRLLDYARPNGNPSFDADRLFWKADQDSTSVSTDERGFVTGDEGHVYNEFVQYKFRSVTPLDLVITAQPLPHHLIQAGVAVHMHHLRYYQHLVPTFLFRQSGFPEVIRYGYTFDHPSKLLVSFNDSRNGAKQPITGAAYVQTQAEYNGLMVQMGMRLDYFNPRDHLPENDLEPLGGDFVLNDNELIPSHSRLSLSPRAGLWCAFNARTAFHAHYGVFRQMPNFETLYTDLDYLAYRVGQVRSFYAFGYPNLELPRTSAFEMGLTHQFNKKTNIDVTVYLKRVVNQTQRTTLVAQPVYYDTYRSRDDATLRGIELSAHLKPVNAIALQTTYVFAHAAGTSLLDPPELDSSPGFLNTPNTSSTKPLPLPFDRRHSLTTHFHADLPYRLWFDAVLQSSTGFPYTFGEASSVQIGQVGTPSPNEALQAVRMPGFFQLDLRMGKSLYVGSMTAEFFIWIINLSNRFNTQSVYPTTGQADASAWLATPEGRDFLDQFGETGRQKYEIKERDPLHYDTPRQIRFGMVIHF